MSCNSLKHNDCRSSSTKRASTPIKSHNDNTVTGLAIPEVLNKNSSICKDESTTPQHIYVKFYDDLKHIISLLSLNYDSEFYGKKTQVRK